MPLSCDLRAAGLCCEHPGNGVKQRVHELVVHNYKAGVEGIDSNQNGPDPPELSVHEVRFCFDAARPFAQPPKPPENPQIQCETDYSAAHQDFEITVVKVERLLAEAADSQIQFRLHWPRAPAPERFLEEHSPAGFIDGATKFDRTAVFKPVFDRVAGAQRPNRTDRQNARGDQSHTCTTDLPAS